MTWYLLPGTGEKCVKIDAGSLAAGENYSALLNVVVIFITTYDPFGLNRMVYTVKNSCVEVPALPYEDGARTIFLYTKGTEGNPPEELFLLARYMEYSTEENAGSAGLKRLHEMVTKVKADREVGVAYMKAIEIEKRIREEGREEGRAEGRAGDVMTFLEAKGTVPPQLERAIYTETDMNVLKDWLLLAAGAASVEEFQKQSGL